jgi:hypothetical protein
MDGRRRRTRVEPTEEWEQLALLCSWPTRRSARGNAPGFEQAEAMLSVSLADVRPLFGESTA